MVNQIVLVKVTIMVTILIIIIEAKFMQLQVVLKPQVVKLLLLAMADSTQYVTDLFLFVTQLSLASKLYFQVTTR